MIIERYSYTTQCMEKKNFYFKNVPQEIRDRICMDYEASYSVTDQITADKITRDILQFVPTTAIITDGTACVGGNTYSFAKSFSNVCAIELDPKRHSYLCQNMSILGLNNVHCIHGDVNIECEKQYQDVIFLDPPWGGPDYKQQTNIQLYLSNKELSEVCIDLSFHCKYIALKVPINFKIDPFDKAVENVLERVHYNTGLRKMHFIIYKCVYYHVLKDIHELI